jgi:hypothetical protein
LPRLLLSAGCWLLTAGCLLFAACDMRPTTASSLLTSNDPLAL